MVDPVNLNVPGLPYLLFAVAFFAVVFVFAWVLSPLELLIRRHERLTADLGGDEGDTSNAGDGVNPPDRFPAGEAITPTTDSLPGSARRRVSEEPPTPTIYECRRCGTTLEAGMERCPRCETASVARYEIG